MDLCFWRTTALMLPNVLFYTGQLLLAGNATSWLFENLIFSRFDGAFIFCVSLLAPSNGANWIIKPMIQRKMKQRFVWLCSCSLLASHQWRPYLFIICIELNVRVACFVPDLDLFLRVLSACVLDQFTFWSKGPLIGRFVLIYGAVQWFYGIFEWLCIKFFINIVNDGLQFWDQYMQTTQETCFQPCRMDHGLTKVIYGRLSRFNSF